ncbi:RNA polymerase subunit AC19 [Puccinia graminis f. sp. tritici]|uniref:RNA polymerase subunit AC19 n=1 Tax=Puccinia graminis f. sp. tritici TaxID=56615 RepID=A0A5B0LT71_PUCGR|nr:RNA polymerase subunit AC19 [Puccinia graminis f. sp. tritici]
MDLEPTHQSTHDPTAEAILADPEKVTILPGDKYDAMTFSLKDEDHTLGNSLRYIIMKKQVLFLFRVNLFGSQGLKA